MKDYFIVGKLFQQSSWFVSNATSSSSSIKYLHPIRTFAFFLSPAFLSFCIRWSCRHLITPYDRLYYTPARTTHSLCEKTMNEGLRAVQIFSNGFGTGATGRAHAHARSHECRAFICVWGVRRQISF